MNIKRQSSSNVTFTSLFSLSKDLFTNASSIDNDFVNQNCLAEYTFEAEQNVGTVLSHEDVAEFVCSCCIVSFSTFLEQRNHFQSKWHLFNLQAKLKGESLLSEKQHQEKYPSKNETLSVFLDTNESDGGEEGSSYEESEEDYEDDLTLATLKDEDEEEDEEIKGNLSDKHFYFSLNDKIVISVEKNLLLCFKEKTIDVLPLLIDRLKALPSKRLWVIILCTAGNFACGVFNEEKCVAHKVFTRYVVRRKRGKAQSQKDGAGWAQSAGASLRRDNEDKFGDEVHELLCQKWKSYIDNADFIFYSAPGANKKYIFEGKQKFDAPLSKSDKRVRSVRFNIKRPTFTEVKNVHTQLSRVLLQDMPKEDFLNSKLPNEPKKAEKQKKKINIENSSNASKSPTSKSSSPKQNTYGLLENTCQQYQLVKENKVELLSEYLQSLSTVTDAEEHVDDVTINSQYLPYGFTLLHLATQLNHSAVVLLLLENGANPTLLDYKDRPAYTLTTKKEVQKIFQTFKKQHADDWKYDVAQIPDLAEITDEQKLKKAAKNKRARENKKRRELENKKKQQEELALEKDRQEKSRQKEKELEEINRLKNMDPRQRARLEAAKRAEAAEKRIAENNLRKKREQEQFLSQYDTQI